MTKVELIYDADCPNVEDARRQLQLALAQAGEPTDWVEWDRSQPESPAHARQYGSPTILIDGCDVAGQSPGDDAACCRLYRGRSGQLRGVPDVETVVSALGGDESSTAHGASGGWQTWLPVIPAVGVSLLPKLACPACWPAYAGLLSAVGLGFLVETKYLLPLTVSFLIVAVAALAWRAQARRGYGPFVVGLLAAVVVMIGKFAFDSDVAMYSGITLLVGASLWNTWPKRSTSSSCPACEPAGQFDHPNRRNCNG